MGDSVLETIAGWFVSNDVKDIAALTHFIRNGIQTLESAPIDYAIWSDTTRAQQLTTLANEVTAIKNQFVETMKPYLPAAWAPSFLPSPDIWKTYQLNVTDAPAVKATMQGIADAAIKAAVTFKEITSVTLPNMQQVPKVPAPKGVLDYVGTLVWWGAGLTALYFGGKALVTYVNKNDAYQRPPRYATRR